MNADLSILLFYAYLHLPYPPIIAPSLCTQVQDNAADLFNQEISLILHHQRCLWRTALAMTATCAVSHKNACIRTWMSSLCASAAHHSSIRRICNLHTKYFLTLASLSAVTSQHHPRPHSYQKRSDGHRQHSP